MKKRNVITVALLGLGFSAYAQQTINASGTDALGSGGSIAYSIGQVYYTTNTNAVGTVAEGVQQPYEISIITTLEQASAANINLQAYPNPTTNFLTLNSTSALLNTQDLSFRLMDMNGKLIQYKRITNITETIAMENLPSATYVLKITSNNNEIKSFKIIKN
jgi:hypothetical protein